MAGHQHYRNAKASMENWEPAYLNLWEAIITPPAAVGGWDFVIQHLTKVGQLETDKQPTIVTQKFRGTTRSYAGSVLEDSSVTLSLDFTVNVNDSNSLYVYKALRRWCDLCYDPLTGTMALKKDYAGGPMTISWYNRVGDIFRQWTFPTVFPASALPVPDLAHDSTDIWAIEGFQFKADYWDETIA